MFTLVSFFSFILAVAIGIFLLKIVFKVSISIIGLIVNAIVGAVVLWVLNLIGLAIPITWLTASIVGLFGLPGIVVLLILKFLFKIF